jgi:hypothetical protein
MTKLLIVFAVVVVVLVLAFLAVRNRRTRDPGDFKDQGGARRGRDGRNRGDYDRPERPARHPGHGGRGGLRAAGEPRRPERSRGDQSRGGGDYDEQHAAHSRVGHRSGHGEPGYGPRPEHSAQAARSQPRGRARSSDRDESGHSSRQERGADVDRDQQRARTRTRTPGKRRDSDGASRSRPDAPVPSYSRLGRSKRSDDSADWPSTEWDKLSDVDYWAELTSDKPLTTTAQPAGPARSARAEQYPGTNGLAGPGVGDSRAPSHADDPSRPARSRPQLAAAPVSAPVPSSDNVVPLPAGRWAVTAREPDFGPVTIPGGSGPQTRPRRPPIIDDDPLTSPSFPRVPASDSRSYRSRGNGRGPESPDAAYSAQTQQFASYGGPVAPSSGTGAPTAERRAWPSAYPDALAAPADDTAQPPGPASTDRYQTVPGSRGRHESRSAPAGAGPLSAAPPPPAPLNPYGSYVSTPPSGGFPAAGSAPAHGGAGSGSYPALPGRARRGQELTGQGSGSCPSAPAAHDSYPPVQDVSDSYPPPKDVSGSYPPPQDPAGWYPQQADRPAPASSAPGELPGSGSFGTRGTGQRGDDGRYYPAANQSGSWPADGYPDGQPGHVDYARGYPHTHQERPAPRAQDPYAPDGYGGQAGYGTFGR